ncbi:hypothetical protein [Microbacterium sp.]|nr:hypothetical protein [Microbacterium sp.]
MSVFGVGSIAESVGARLVSCDVRDLVSKGLAILPGDALADADST